MRSARQHQTVRQNDLGAGDTCNQDKFCLRVRAKLCRAWSEDWGQVAMQMTQVITRQLHRHPQQCVLITHPWWQGAP